MRYNGLFDESLHAEQPEILVYAVIDHHGKQCRVQTGDRIQVDLLSAEEGDLIEFDRILLIGGDGKTHVGTPQLPGARVLAEVIRHEKGPKLTMMRFKATKNRQAKKGHRQKYTCVLIREIHPE